MALFTTGKTTDKISDYCKPVEVSIYGYLMTLEKILDLFSEDRHLR